MKLRSHGHSRTVYLRRASGYIGGMKEHTNIIIRQMLSEGVDWSEYSPEGKPIKGYYSNKRIRGGNNPAPKKKKKTTASSYPSLVRDLRNHFGITQKELADKIGVANFMSISGWERGNNDPSQPFAERLIEFAKQNDAPKKLIDKLVRKYSRIAPQLRSVVTTRPASISKSVKERLKRGEKAIYDLWRVVPVSSLNRLTKQSRTRYSSILRSKLRDDYTVDQLLAAMSRAELIDVMLALHIERHSTLKAAIRVELKAALKK